MLPKRSLVLVLLVACVGVGSVAPVVAAPSPPRVPALEVPHVSDELLVKLPPAGRRLLAGAGAQVLAEIPELKLALVRAPAGRALADAAFQLEAAGVEWAEPNYTFTLEHAPDDPHYLGSQSIYMKRIDAAGAWDVTRGRPEIVLAVLDTGVDLSHEDLRDAIWTNKGEVPGNMVDDDGNGFVDDVHGWDFADWDNDPSDDHYHGTHVAGIAAARIDNGVGIAGMAGEVTIMPVDVFAGGIGTYADLIRAIVYATDNGARVINMSLGASSYSLGEQAAVDYAVSRGVVVVAAAGNKGREERHYPAAHEAAIAVASTTADDFLSPFSVRGDWVDVAAPGSGIYSTYPGNAYGYLSGTSMATPHVAGLAALILSLNPTLTPAQVRAAIENTADDLQPPGRDIYFGAGRINAGRALASIDPVAGPIPMPAPGARQDLDLPGCSDLVVNGGFENGLFDWQTSGAVGLDPFVAGAGAGAAYFPGWPRDREVLQQDITVPAGATAAVVKFLYRIDPADAGRGASPDSPFDDKFTVEWRTRAGDQLAELLRTGNTADTVQAGLEWDEYLFRLSDEDLAALRDAGRVSLVFTSENDGDSLITKVWVDSVQVCALVVRDLPVRARLPIIFSGR